MKKRLFQGLVACISVLFFSIGLIGCGAGNSNTEVKSNSTQAQNVESKPTELKTIKVWSHNRHDKDMWEKWIADYNDTVGKEHGIKIEYSLYGDDYLDVLNLAFSSGQGPDICTNWAPTLYIKNGNFLALDDMPGGKEFIKLYDGLLKPIVNVVDGKTYGVPYAATTYKLAYNKELFKKNNIVDGAGEAKPPATWDEVVADARIITDAGAGKEFGLMFPMKWGDFFKYELLIPFYPSIGHEAYDAKAGKFNFSDFKPAFDNYLMKIKKDKSYFPGPESLDPDPARAQFSEGKIGMIMAASWDVGVFNDQFPAKMDWGIADFPVMDLNAKHFKEAMSVEVNLWISKFARNNDLQKVMEVYKWFLEDKKLARLYEEAKYIPYNDSVIKMAQKKPTKKGFAEFSTGNFYIQPVEPTYDIKLEGPDFYNTMMKIWTGELDVAEGLADLDKRYNAALDAAVQKGDIKLQDYVDTSFSAE